MEINSKFFETALSHPKDTITATSTTFDLPFNGIHFEVSVSQKSNTTELFNKTNLTKLFLEVSKAPEMFVKALIGVNAWCKVHKKNKENL